MTLQGSCGMFPEPHENVQGETPALAQLGAA